MANVSDVLVEVAPIEPEVSIAHRRGGPLWPRCLPVPSPVPNPTGWREIEYGRAVELGAVPCKAAECTGPVTA